MSRVRMRSSTISLPDLSANVAGGRLPVGGCPTLMRGGSLCNIFSQQMTFLLVSSQSALAVMKWMCLWKNPGRQPHPTPLSSEFQGHRHWTSTVQPCQGPECMAF